MANIKPRISVSLSDDAKAALDRFTSTTGIASSQFVGQLIDGAIPVIDATTEAFRIARSSPQAAAAHMSEVLNRAMIAGAQEKLELEAAAKTKRLRKTSRRD